MTDRLKAQMQACFELLTAVLDGGVTCAMVCRSGDAPFVTASTAPYFEACSDGCGKFDIWTRSDIEGAQQVANGLPHGAATLFFTSPDGVA